MSYTWRLIKGAFTSWTEDKAPRLGAALAYYTAFSMGPLLVIAVGVAGLVFGEEAAQGQIVAQISGLVGDDAATALETVIQKAGERTGAGITATLIGLGTLLFGASGVFGELQDSLNTIWGVKPRPGRGFGGILKDRFFSFALVMGVAFILLVSLVVSAALAALGKMGTGAVGESLLHVLNFAVSLAVVTGLFAALFKYVPDVRIEWRDVWFGAGVTALLFTLGKLVIGLYLGKASVASAFGAAGSLIIVLVWVYYSAQILFFGAEVTKVHARLHGRGLQPDADAVRVTAVAQGEPILAPVPTASLPALPAVWGGALRIDPWWLALAGTAVGFGAGRLGMGRLVRGLASPEFAQAIRLAVVLAANRR